MAQTQTRVGGSGWTEFSFQGKRLAWLTEISDNAPAPVAQPVAIQPLDEPHPVEIVTAGAFGAGTITLTFQEIWNEEVWHQLPGFDGTASLIDVFRRQLTLGNISCRKIIKVPNGPYRAKVYHGCVITNVNESERINIQSMAMPKTVEIRYTHTTTV